MIRSIAIFAVLVLVCVPLLIAGFFFAGLGALFIKPACRLGNKLGGYTWEDMFG